MTNLSLKIQVRFIGWKTAKNNDGHKRSPTEMQIEERFKNTNLIIKLDLRFTKMKNQKTPKYTSEVFDELLFMCYEQFKVLLQIRNLTIDKHTS